MTMETPVTTFSIRLTPDELVRLDARCAATRLTRSGFVRRLLQEGAVIYPPVVLAAKPERREVTPRFKG